MNITSFLCSYIDHWDSILVGGQRSSYMQRWEGQTFPMRSPTNVHLAKTPIYCFLAKLVDNRISQYSTICYIMFYYIILYCIILYYIIWILYNIILYYFVLCYIILYYIIVYYIIFFNILLYIILFYFILHYIILYYIILHYITLYILTCIPLYLIISPWWLVSNFSTHQPRWWPIPAWLCPRILPCYYHNISRQQSHDTTIKNHIFLISVTPHETSF